MSSHADELYPALFEGLPAVVKLVTGETVIAVVLVDDDQDQYVLDRPLVLTTRMSPDDPDVTVARIERWVPPSGEVLFPLYADLIVSMTLTTDALVPNYFRWADALYAPLVEALERRQHAPQESEPDEQDYPLFTPPDAQCTTAQREQHYYRLMMVHTPKTGLPN